MCWVRIIIPRLEQGFWSSKRRFLIIQICLGTKSLQLSFGMFLVTRNTADAGLQFEMVHMELSLCSMQRTQSILTRWPTGLNRLPNPKEWQPQNALLSLTTQVGRSGQKLESQRVSPSLNFLIPASSRAIRFTWDLTNSSSESWRRSTRKWKRKRTNCLICEIYRY